jgi:hypothetical protein
MEAGSEDAEGEAAGEKGEEIAEPTKQLAPWHNPRSLRRPVSGLRAQDGKSSCESMRRDRERKARQCSGAGAGDQQQAEASEKLIATSLRTPSASRMPLRQSTQSAVLGEKAKPRAFRSRALPTARVVQQANR